jgi:hypothetical protein
VRGLLLVAVLALLVASCAPAIPPFEPQLEIPAGFPEDVPIPEGAFTLGYTGSAEIGFELNLMTAMTNDDLKAFVADAVAETDSWPLTLADAGVPALQGYEADWAMVTRDGQVITGPFGTYDGGILADGSGIDIVLSPAVQPADDEEPAELPAGSVLPRPNSPLDRTTYTGGRIKLTYEGKAGAFDALIDRYRALDWDEKDVVGYGSDAGDPEAVGDLAKWRITVRDFSALGGPISLEFENLTLSFP